MNNVHFDIEKIKTDFKSVIQYSQGIDDPKIDELFEKWLNNKSDFIKHMDGELIQTIATDVVFELSDTEKLRRFQDFVYALETKWGCNSNFLAYIENQGQDALFNNLTTIDWESPVDRKKITKGTKFLKSFKYFISDQRCLTDIQNEASRIIQLNKIEGDLCLSVHPLDYLSLSENDHQWRSCHALDGEYRAGNLSYMLDNSTVICYLKSKEETKLPRFPYSVPWNSKKWRVLLFLSNDWTMAFAGRPYPFASSIGMDIIQKEVLPKFVHNIFQDEWSKWNDKIITEIPLVDENFYLEGGGYVPIGRGNLIRLHELVKDAPLSTHYNDVLNSSCYSPIYAFKKTTDLFITRVMTDRKSTRFILGSEVKCLHCGEQIIGINDSMACRDCHNKYYNEDNNYYCDCCGSAIREGECFWVQEVPLCEHCFDIEASECECCGDAYFNTEITFSKLSSQYLCPWCLKTEAENADINNKNESEEE